MFGEKISGSYLNPLFPLLLVFLALMDRTLGGYRLRRTNGSVRISVPFDSYVLRAGSHGYESIVKKLKSQSGSMDKLMVNFERLEDS